MTNSSKGAIKLQDKFNLIVQKWHLQNLHVKNFIVGLSSGPDSTALLILLHRYCCVNDFKLIAAHVKHGWGVIDEKYAEGEEERRRSCVELCTKLNIKLEIFDGSVKDFVKAGNGSLECAGRLMRYFFFNHLLEKYNNAVIVLAHTLNDNLETFFIKLIRGASLGGLACMKEFRDSIFRPLLSFNKEALIDFLRVENIKFNDDASNYDEKFLRARIRKKLMPILSEIDERFEESISKTMNNLQEACRAIDFIIKNIYNIDFNEKVEIDLTLFCNMPVFLQKEIIGRILIYHSNNDSINISEPLINDVIKFVLKINKQANSHIVNNLKVSKHKNKILFTSAKI